MWALAEVETFIRERCVGTIPDGEAVLKQADALALLTSLMQEGGPNPAYVDVYSRTAAGEWCFEEDLTMRNIHEVFQSSQEYASNLLRYLRDVPESRYVALCDFADPGLGAVIRDHPV